MKAKLLNLVYTILDPAAGAKIRTSFRGVLSAIGVWAASSNTPAAGIVAATIHFLLSFAVSGIKTPSPAAKP